MAHIKRYDLGSTTQGDWQVHKAGCRDTRDFSRVMGKYNHVERNVVADSPKDLIKDCLNEHDGELRGMGYDETYFRIMPCCQGAKKAPQWEEPRNEG